MRRVTRRNALACGATLFAAGGFVTTTPAFGQDEEAPTETPPADEGFSDAGMLEFSDVPENTVLPCCFSMGWFAFEKFGCGGASQAPIVVRRDTSVLEFGATETTIRPSEPTDRMKFSLATGLGETVTLTAKDRFGQVVATSEVDGRAGVPRSPADFTTVELRGDEIYSVTLKRSEVPGGPNLVYLDRISGKFNPRKVFDREIEILKITKPELAESLGNTEAMNKAYDEFLSFYNGDLEYSSPVEGEEGESDGFHNVTWGCIIANVAITAGLGALLQGAAEAAGVATIAEMGEAAGLAALKSVGIVGTTATFLLGVFTGATVLSIAVYNCTQA